MPEEKPLWEIRVPVAAEAGLWQGYTLDSSAAEIRRRFEAKYGYPPDKVVSGGSIILAGPVREKG